MFKEIVILMAVPWNSVFLLFWNVEESGIESGSGEKGRIDVLLRASKAKTKCE